MIIKSIKFLTDQMVLMTGTRLPVEKHFPNIYFHAQGSYQEFPFFKKVCVYNNCILRDIVYYDNNIIFNQSDTFEHLCKIVHHFYIYEEIFAEFHNRIYDILFRRLF